MSISCNRRLCRFTYNNRLISVVTIFHCPATISKTKVADNFLLSALFLLQYKKFSVRNLFHLSLFDLFFYFKYNHCGILISFMNFFFAQDNGHLWRFIIRSHLYIFRTILFAHLTCTFSTTFISPPLYL